MDIEYLENIIDDGYADVKCSKCNEYERIEPDAEIDCDCGGKFTSPLLVMGLI